MKKYRNRGVKNFKWDTKNPDLMAIYSYLARPKISSLKSKINADIFVIDFCHNELDFIGGLRDCANLVQRNWKLFKKAVILNS